MSELLGYARTSTREQDPAAQVAELEAAGCARVFVDHGEPSRRRDRPELLALLEYARDSDVLVVRRIDRLAGSDRMLLDLMSELHDRGIGIRSLTETAVDTTTPWGRAIWGFQAVLVQLRVDTIRENTMRGLQHARAQGRVGGRPPALTAAQVAEAAQMHARGCTVTHIAGVLGVSRATIYRALARAAG